MNENIMEELEEVIVKNKERSNKLAKLYTSCSFISSFSTRITLIKWTNINI